MSVYKAHQAVAMTVLTHWDLTGALVPEDMSCLAMEEHVQMSMNAAATPMAAVTFVSTLQAATGVHAPQVTDCHRMEEYVLTLMNAGTVILAQWECATILKDPLHARVPLGGSKDLLAHVSLEEK